MFHVGNSGKANSMYYAYSISLMYFLRAKNASMITEDIFNKLQLREEDKVRLRPLLAKESGQEFTSEEITTIIEPILGRAARNLAAERVAVEFKEAPQDNPLFFATKYGFKWCMKHSFETNGSDLGNLIDPDFNNKEYTEAEIYKIDGMKEAMIEFTSDKLFEVIEEFNRLWEIKKQEKQPSGRDIKFYKENLLDDLLGKVTVDFFSATEYERLNQYKKHLQGGAARGSEETLFALHRAIQGKRMERNQQGTLDTLYDTEILLDLHGGESSSFMESGNPEMILSNLRNILWASKIPESIFVRKPSESPAIKIDEAQEKPAQEIKVHEEAKHQTKDVAIDKAVQMLEVDNSGRGNCMYYAYSISLMYFLRAKNAAVTTEDIFNKLKLQEEDKVRLRALLAKDPKEEFTSEEIRTIIEPILGRATRDLAAEQTKEEFKKSPNDTSLFSASQYGVEYFFKHLIEESEPELASLIEHEFTNPNYTAAEIYEVDGLKKSMREFTSERSVFIIAEFKRQWEIQEQELKEQEKKLTASEERNYKAAVLDNILRHETVRFFSDDDYKRLDNYINHLQKEHVWGSDETLFVLHRAIQGERTERNQQGTVDMFYDNEILLHLYKNGSSPFVQAGSPVMILNNKGNIHWTSKIPLSVFVPKPSKLSVLAKPHFDETKIETQMLRVNNSGRGNCMYYAYSISLMYFLRAKNVAATTEDIFNKLHLQEEDKVRLRVLLAKNPKQEFTAEEIRTVIEPVLGRATRNLAAERTIDEFKSSPQTTSLFSASKYGLEHYFKQLLMSDDPELAKLIDHQFTNPDYTEAEIYRVSGMKSAMQQFAACMLATFREQFNHQWEVKERVLKEQGKELSVSEMQVHKANVLDNIMRNKTVEFFSADEFKHLDHYKKHLEKQYVWGSDETLLVLHRAIQGEHFVRNQQGTVDTLYDTEILLHLHKNGRSAVEQAGSPVMILNNENNVHWTSKIPLSVYEPSPTVNEQKLYKILDDMQIACDEIPSDLEDHAIASKLIASLNKQIDISKENSKVEVREKVAETSMQLIRKTISRLGKYDGLVGLFFRFFLALIEYTPALLRSEFKSKLSDSREEFVESVQKSDEEINSTHSPKGILSESKHTLFKTQPERCQKIYPRELIFYVRESKQTGIRVADALKKMYQEGVEGNEQYSLEKCRDIAQRYISYVQSKGRKFNLNEVKEFIRKMDELIKQKEAVEDKPVEIEYVEGTPFI